MRNELEDLYRAVVPYWGNMDHLHDTVVLCLENEEEWVPEEEPFVLFFDRMHNRATSRLQTKRKRGVDQGELLVEGIYERFLTTDITPENTVIADQQFRLMLLACSDFTDAKILTLMRMEELNRTEVADRIGLTQQAVSLRLKRVKNRYERGNS